MRILNQPTIVPAEPPSPKAAPPSTHTAPPTRPDAFAIAREAPLKEAAPLTLLSSTAPLVRVAPGGGGLQGGFDPVPLPLPPDLGKLLGGLTPKHYDAGDLYGPNGPQESDIQQKNIGDCYFDASLGVLAQQDPSRVENAIHYDDKTGNFTVTLYDKGPDGKPEKREIVVTQADLQDNLKRGGSSKAGSGGPLWPAVMESAYAKMHLEDASKNGPPDPRIDGGYGPATADDLGPDGVLKDANGNPIPELDANGKPKVGLDGKPIYKHKQVQVGGMGGGGWAGDAMYALTGDQGHSVEAPKPIPAGANFLERIVDQLQIDATGRQLQSALDSGSEVTVSVDGEQPGQAKDGLVNHHVYMVNRVYQDANGVWQVELRNPWGNNGSDGHGHGEEGKGDGGAVITVPLSSIHTYSYEGFEITSVPS